MPGCDVRSVNTCIRKWTLAKLASSTGIQRTYLSQKMHGKSRWYRSDLIAVASALDTSVAFLVGETTEPRRITDGVLIDADEYRDFLAWCARRDSNSNRRPVIQLKRSISPEFSAVCDLSCPLEIT